MSRLRDSAVRVVNLFRRERIERELDAELRAYLELEVEENIRRGMAPKEARRAALARLGGVETVKEECRDVQRFRVVEDLWRDLRHGFRRLLARPVLAVVAVAVLAVGIGANIAILALHVDVDRGNAAMRDVRIAGDSRVVIDRGDLDLELASEQAVTVHADVSRRARVTGDLPGATRHSARRWSMNGGGPELKITADRGHVWLRSN